MPFAPAARDAGQRFTVHAMDLWNIPFAAAAAATAYPLTNLALFVPFSVPIPCIAKEGWVNAATVAGGNFDVGIYDAGGTRLTSSGSTARTVSITNNTTAMTDYTMSPGIVYYMAFAADSTNNYFAGSPAAGLCEAWGILEMQTAFVLPATATYVKTTRAYIPQFGLNLQGTAL